LILKVDLAGQAFRSGWARSEQFDQSNWDSSLGALPTGTLTSAARAKARIAQAAHLSHHRGVGAGEAFGGDDVEHAGGQQLDGGMMSSAMRAVERSSMARCDAATARRAGGPPLRSRAEMVAG